MATLAPLRAVKREAAISRRFVITMECPRRGHSQFPRFHHVLFLDAIKNLNVVILDALTGAVVLNRQLLAVGGKRERATDTIASSVKGGG